MISRRTKLQLAVFVAITLLGVSFVGARYAKLDRFVLDRSYDVTAHFRDSGGIFVGAEVTYRGVGVGQVSDMTLTDEGVDVELEIDNSEDDIPADTIAVVADRSAVGEQYVDLQPRTNDGPYLEDGSTIAMDDTRLPISTTKLLLDVDGLVHSVNQDNLRTMVSESGDAFESAGDDLSRIIDTSNAFIEAADANFDVTAALIRDSRTVLQTQLDSADHIETFVHNLRLLSDTLVASDSDLRTLIDEGSLTADVVRQFIADNSAAIGKLLGNVISNNRVVTSRLAGVEVLFEVYPYPVEGGFAVVDKDPYDGLYDAHFGLVLTTDPHNCTKGYGGTEHRSPHDRSEEQFNLQARCTISQSQGNARGAQNSPYYDRSVPVVGTYDRTTGKVTPADRSDLRVETGDVPTRGLSGSAAWAWLFTGGMMAR
jgi:phospholipid/cholesterol/gamma-HCH transport system substrate-binding protein